MDNNISITLDDLINKYESLSSDETRINLIKAYIKRTYCPIIEKQAMIKLAIEESTIKEANGNTYIDMFILRMNIIMAIIMLYTNIVVDNGERNIFEAYDKIVRNNIAAIVSSLIGESEMSELTCIQSALLDTFTNKNTLVSYICDFLMHISTAMDLISERGNAKLQEMIEDGRLRKILNEIEDLEGAGISNDDGEIG